MVTTILFYVVAIGLVVLLIINAAKKRTIERREKESVEAFRKDVRELEMAYSTVLEPKIKRLDNELETLAGTLENLDKGIPERSTITDLSPAEVISGLTSCYFEDIPEYLDLLDKSHETKLHATVFDEQLSSVLREIRLLKRELVREKESRLNAEEKLRRETERLAALINSGPDIRRYSTELTQSFEDWSDSAYGFYGIRMNRLGLFIPRKEKEDKGIVQ